MRSILVIALGTVVLGQTVPACTAEMVATDDCAAVIDANACYNKYRFSGKQTLSCIDGTDDKDRARKVCPPCESQTTLTCQACKCCGCVGAAMCNWTKTQKLC